MVAGRAKVNKAIKVWSKLLPLTVLIMLICNGAFIMNSNIEHQRFSAMHDIGIRLFPNMASELFKITGENRSWQGSFIDWLLCPTDKNLPTSEVIFSWHRAEVFDGDIKVHIDSLCEIVRVKYVGFGGVG